MKIVEADISEEVAQHLRAWFAAYYKGDARRRELTEEIQRQLVRAL